MDSSHQILQPPEQLCLACQLQSLEMHPRATRETGKLRSGIGKKGKAAGNMHYLKCCRMRDRCWHGICEVESHPAHAASWQASLVSKPQLCKTHHHNWHPGWQSRQGPAIMVTGMFLLLPLYLHPAPQHRQGSQTAPAWETHMVSPFQGLSMHHQDLNLLKGRVKRAGRKAKGCVCSLIYLDDPHLTGRASS